MSETSETENPVIAHVKSYDVSSAIAVAGHPLHAMSVHFPIALVIGTLALDLLYWFFADPFFLRAGTWAAGAAFISGVGAGIIGTGELILVKGIRVRAASWTHAVAAMTLLSIAGANWGLRIAHPEAVLPLGLFLSCIAAAVTGLAGWYGGKLIFDHGVGILVGDEDR
ncbi:DUF2231 domain-containing protein [Aureimonas frigidaquae]|uniref:DUF2231 domain-containing protein n=1 Tax=Aureimonas frigidaquae TaxID=424757 RepID=UPI0009FA955B|nr:DUF2231 domain-containing protein [Aureimonas frigidaquae]